MFSFNADWPVTSVFGPPGKKVRLETELKQDSDRPQATLLEHGWLWHMLQEMSPPGKQNSFCPAPSSHCDLHLF